MISRLANNPATIFYQRMNTNIFSGRTSVPSVMAQGCFARIVIGIITLVAGRVVQHWWVSREDIWGMRYDPLLLTLMGAKEQEAVYAALRRRELLEDFCRRMEEWGYLDSDWWSEEPDAIDRYEEHLREIK